MSGAFAYNAVDVNKIVAVSSIIPPLYAYAQVTAGRKLNFGQSDNLRMVNIISQIPTL